jgi:hypothetical protein
MPCPLETPTPIKLGLDAIGQLVGFAAGGPGDVSRRGVQHTFDVWHATCVISNLAK